MGVKKQKRVRKSVRFYTACFGFREPYKILCDGTFVHHLLLHRIPHSQLSSLLGAPTKLFLTRCILAELKSLGESYSSSLHSARHLLTARCDHERRKSAAGCIEDVIGENNSEHFFVATQDADLRMKFREKPGIPLIYGLRNSLFLETPSEYQRQFVKSTEEERLHMNQSEFKMLKKRVASQAETDSSYANEGLGNEVVMKRDLTKTEKAKKVLGVVDKVKFKRKQAKMLFMLYNPTSSELCRAQTHFHARRRRIVILLQLLKIQVVKLTVMAVKRGAGKERGIRKQGWRIQ